MNDARRKIIEQAKTKLDDARAMIEQCRDDEQESFDNMPENMQSGEKGEQIESNAQSLGECVDNIDNAIADLDNIQ